MKQQDNKAELEQLRKEIEQLKYRQNRGVFSRISDVAKNSVQSPLSTIVSILCGSPVIYKGIVNNDNTLVTLGIGVLTNGVLNNERTPPNNNTNPTL